MSSPENGGVKPATRNLVTSIGKKSALAALKRFPGPFIDFLMSNLAVPDEALGVMGLRTRCVDRSDETRRIILSAAWVNPRLQEGPWSDGIAEVID
jgi:hypothetical protein